MKRSVREGEEREREETVEGEKKREKERGKGGRGESGRESEGEVIDKYVSDMKLNVSAFDTFNPDLLSRLDIRQEIRNLSLSLPFALRFGMYQISLKFCIL